MPASPGAQPDAEPLVLAGEFPAASREQWVAQVGRVLLKDAATAPDDVETAIRKRLVTATDDGIDIQPLYTPQDAVGIAERGAPGLFPFVRGGRAVPGPWDVRQRVLAGATDDRAVVAELERGATSLLVQLDAGTPGAAAVADVLDTTLAGVYLDLVAVVLDAGDRWSEAAEALLRLWEHRRVTPASASGVLGADPISVHARTGGATQIDGELRAAASLAARVASTHAHVRAIVADGTVFHDAGASDADELAAGLAAGVEYLRALTAAGVDVDAAFGQLEFRFCATADQFATVAKLRAARRCWARVAQASGASARAGRQVQHAITSRAMWTTYDPWVNLLRGTTAAFAAGVGGADAITVLPFDELSHPGGSALGRRLARNTQLLLVQESNVARVADPAGGSWYVERLTDELAAEAWRTLQWIESSGGLVAALDSGAISERLSATRRARDGKLATRRMPLTGLSEFPDIDEPVPHTVPSDLRAIDGDGPRFPPLAARRYAAAFEAQRQRADAAAGSGQRPMVFLATLGSIATHTARATFAKNLFEVAGIRAVTAADPVIETPADVAAAFRASGAQLACICSSDAVYGELASSTASALRDAGATAIYLAGKPGEHEAAWRDAGVAEFVFVGCDVLDVVSRALDRVLGEAR